MALTQLESRPIYLVLTTMKKEAPHGNDLINPNEKISFVVDELLQAAFDSQVLQASHPRAGKSRNSLGFE